MEGSLSCDTGCDTEPKDQSYVVAFHDKQLSRSTRHSTVSVKVLRRQSSIWSNKGVVKISSEVSWCQFWIYWVGVNWAKKSKSITTDITGLLIRHDKMLVCYGGFNVIFFFSGWNTANTALNTINQSITFFSTWAYWSHLHVYIYSACHSVEQSLTQSGDVVETSQYLCPKNP